jgi:DNA polymerase-3 subunit beta
MLITVNKDMLLKALGIADAVVSSKNINTILSNCLFNVQNNFIEITATDNEIAVKTTIDAKSDTSISFTTYGKKFINILRELPDDEISLDINESMVINLNSKNIKGKYTLYGTDSSDFPELPEIKIENSVEIDQGIFKEMIKKVIYAAATDTIKPVFNSIYIVSEKPGTLTLIATDSRRLSMITRTIDDEAFIGEGIIIPLKTIHEINRLLSNSGTCKISFDSNQCYFKIDNTEVFTRIVDGQYPNYKQIIPREYTLKSVINTSQIHDSVKRAMIFTREPANKIVISFSKDNLKIQANTPELGYAEEEIEIECNSSNKIVIGINAQFFIDTIRHIDSFSLICGITGQMSPLTIIPDDDKNFISVIMPIQIKTIDE